MPRPRGKSKIPPELRDEATTPQPFVDALAAREDVRFALDPFATAENAKAPRFYTKEQDGFAQPWNTTSNRRECVFANPPYSDDNIMRACRKAYNERGNYDLAFLLLPANTGSAWYHAFAPRVERIIFIRGRIHYIGPYTNGNDTDSLVLVFSRDASLFTDVGIDFWTPTPAERGLVGRASRPGISLSVRSSLAPRSSLRKEVPV